MGGRDDEFVVEITSRPYAGLVKAFYDAYARAFMLPDERESLAGFRACLKLNGAQGAALHRRFGPSREYIGAIRRPDGEIAAGMNFICFPMAAFRRMVTIHSIYVFVAPGWRGRGLLRRIYDVMEREARRYGSEHGLGADAAVTFFGEQNDPFRMSLGAFERDTKAAGLDQFDRLAIWRRLGARILAFPYVQPALSAHGNPDRTLFLRVLLDDERGVADPSPVRRLDPSLLREHLRRFFGITVVKGRCDPGVLPEVAAQESVLEELIADGRQIAARQMPAGPVLAGWKVRIAAVLRRHDRDLAASVGSLLGFNSVEDYLGRLAVRQPPIVGASRSAEPGHGTAGASEADGA